MSEKAKASMVCRCDSLLFRDLNPAIKIDSPCWNGSDFCQENREWNCIPDLHKPLFLEVVTKTLTREGNADS